MERGTVLVTGAGHRLGFQFTKSLLQNGFSLIAHYNSNCTELQSWLDDNSEYSAKLTFCKADCLVSIEPLQEKILENKSSLVGLVNSASLFEPGNLEDVQSLKKQVSLNSFVPVDLGSIFIKEVGKGQIVNIVDANIERVNLNFQNYRISKLIHEELTRQLAAFGSPHVRVNGLAPGTVLPPEPGPDKSYKSASEKQLLPYPVSLDNLLRGFWYLWENSSVTGEILHVDGGVHCL